MHLSRESGESKFPACIHVVYMCTCAHYKLVSDGIYMDTYTCTCMYCTSLVGGENSGRVQPPRNHVSRTPKLHVLRRGHALPIRGGVTATRGGVGEIRGWGALSWHGGIRSCLCSMMVVDCLYVEATAASVTIVDRFHLAENPSDPFWLQRGVLIVGVLVFRGAPVIIRVGWRSLSHTRRDGMHRLGVLARGHTLRG